MARKTFKVTCKEEGRGKPSSESFTTLAEARDYIRDRWQGVEYIDGTNSFHTDYCSYKCVGFNLADIGNRRWREDWLEWDWLDLDAKNTEEENPLALQLYSAFERYDSKQIEESEPPPF